MNALRFAEETKAEVAKEKAQTLVVLLRIRIIEEKKIFAELGYSSIWEFVSKYLEYDEGQTSRRIGAARLTQLKLSYGNVTTVNALGFHQ